MAEPKITKAGSTPLKKVGHTIGQTHGSDPMVKKRGPNTTTEITFGGK